MLETTRASSGRGKRGRRWGLALGAGLSLATAAGVVRMIAPAVRTRPSGFTPRGAAVGPSDVELQLICTSGTLAACPRGAKVVFAVRGGAPGGYLAAWADPVGGGERVWYFSAEGQSPHLAAGAAGASALARGVRIGAELAAGTYDVHMVLSTDPLARVAVAHLGSGTPGILAQRTVSLTVVGSP